jgi:hypothetical protein
MVSVPISRDTKCSWSAWLLKMGPIDCPETPVTDYPYTLCYTQKIQEFIHTPLEAWDHAIYKVPLIIQNVTP